VTTPTDRDPTPELEATTPISEAEGMTGRSTIGRYRIDRVLGRGGMGVVVAAHDPELDRLVAVKILIEHGARGEILGAALRREAQALARVTHPNVLSVYDAGVDGSPYLVMQLVDGETLGAHLQRTKPTPAQIIALFVQASRGLSAIHAAGLIHRDVKPSNILVDKRGVVHVADLGLARIGELAQRGDGGSVPTTQTNTIAGTPAYMAPEQFDRRELTPACDQFSFCVALWEALVGHRPFRGSSEQEIAKAVRDAPPDARVDGVSKSQLAAIRRGLSTEPNARFASMEDLAAALGGSSPSRRPLLVIGGLALAGAAAIGGALVLVAWTSDSPTPRPDAPVAIAPSRPKPSGLDLVDMRRLTLTDACDEYPSIAPDGTIYYDATVGADQHLMAYDAKTRESRELTQTKGWDMAPKVSPDGKRIVFLRKAADMMAAHVANLDDLASAKQVVPGGFRPSWSPDGQIWAGGRKGISRYHPETLAITRTLKLPEGAFPMAAIELADRRVVVLTKSGSANADGLYIYDKGDSDPRALIPASDANPMDEVLALAPGGDGVLVGKWQATNTIEIWHVPLDGSPSVAVSGAAINARKFLEIADKRIVWSDCTEALTLATLSHTSTGATKFDALSRNNWMDFSPQAVPGTDDIILLSYRSTLGEVWRMSKNGDRPRAIPFGTHELDRMTISHDGTWIVGNNDTGVYAGPIDGSAPPTKVHEDDHSEQNAVFSRDGQTIFLELREGKKDRIASMPRAGGATTWVVPAPSMAPATSPTADVLAYLTEVPGEKVAQRVIVLLDLATNKSRTLAVPPYPYRDLRWHSSGKRLLAIRRDGQIAEIDVATSKILRTFDVGASQIVGSTYVGDDIMVGHAGAAGDIWEGTLR
jgi:serine/threonine protein kinase/WD40 repeat protein